MRYTLIAAFAVVSWISPVQIRETVWPVFAVLGLTGPVAVVARRLAAREPTTERTRRLLAAVDALDALADMLLTASVGVVLAILLTPLSPVPVADSVLAWPERVIGLTQADLFLAARASGGLDTLTAAYRSVLWQPLLLTAYAVAIGDATEIRRMARAFALTAPVGLVAYVLLPAAGPWVVYDLGSATPAPTFLASFEAMRAGTATVVPLDGFVTCPSFHAVLAVLLTRAWCRTPFGHAAVLWNAALLASTWICGFHYLTDLVVGVALAQLATAATDRSAPTDLSARWAALVDRLLAHPRSSDPRHALGARGG